MIPEIIIIVVLAILLYILLKHWPETLEATKFQQLNARKPQEESEQKPKRDGRGKKDKVNIWQLVVTSVTKVYESVVSVFGLNGKKKEIPLTGDDYSVSEESSEFDNLLLKAEMAQRKGSYDIAEKHLLKAATLEPKDPKVYSKIGILYLEQGENWEDAEKSFRQALKYDKNNGFVHNNLGLVMYYQDKFSAARKEFEKAVSVDNSIASRHINLGLAYMSLRQFVKAESSYKRALKLDTNNEEYEDLVKEAGEKRKTHQR